MTELSLATLPPGLLLVVAAVPVALLPHRLSQAAMLALPVLGLAHLLSMPAEVAVGLRLFDFQLEITRVDALSRAVGIVFYVAAFLGVLYAAHQRDRLQAAAALVYAGAAIAGATVEVLVGISAFLHRFLHQG